jgi:hypothetical protein
MNILAHPEIIAAFIAGIFAVLCKVLERKPVAGEFSSRRGFLGWLVIIAAIFSVALSVFSISASRRKLSQGGWDESKKQGTVLAEGNLICYGYVEGSPVDHANRTVVVVFSKPFEYAPTVTDSVWTKSDGARFAPISYEVTPIGFMVQLFSGDDRSSNQTVRYNWSAMGRAKQ